jgi:hypothetical protein
MTTNIQDHIKAISTTSLPKTFQDAVEVTSAIGLRYRWIDFLCIIQDDRDDWFRESQKMGLVYQYAASQLQLLTPTTALKGYSCKA